MDPLRPYIQQRVAAEIAQALREKIIIPQREVAITDQAGILRLDIRGVLTNQVEIVDDRERLAQ
jgi:hypothetical protein